MHFLNQFLVVTLITLQDVAAEWQTIKDIPFDGIQYHSLHQMYDYGAKERWREGEIPLHHDQEITVGEEYWLRGRKLFIKQAKEVFLVETEDRFLEGRFEVSVHPPLHGVQSIMVLEADALTDESRNLRETIGFVSLSCDLGFSIMNRASIDEIRVTLLVSIADEPTQRWTSHSDGRRTTVEPIVSASKPSSPSSYRAMERWNWPIWPVWYMESYIIERNRTSVTLSIDNRILHSFDLGLTFGSEARFEDVPMRWRFERWNETDPYKEGFALGRPVVGDLRIINFTIASQRRSQTPSSESVDGLSGFMELR